MSGPLKLMAVLAHPDDESLGFGGTLARYAAENVETYLIVATRGEMGWHGPGEENPGPRKLGEIREAELRAAVRALDIKELHLLEYVDGQLDQADPAEIIATLSGLLRQIRPQVVITFGPGGAYGHPDHIAISQFATAAILRAADSQYAPAAGSAHAVSKFYYRVWTPAAQRMYAKVFGELVIPVDGQRRTFVGWEDWMPTSRVDASRHWRTVWQAVNCHRSQLPAYSAFGDLSEAEQINLWGADTYYRVFSTVNGGRRMEIDLFEGLRDVHDERGPGE